MKKSLSSVRSSVERTALVEQRARDIESATAARLEGLQTQIMEVHASAAQARRELDIEAAAAYSERARELVGKLGPALNKPVASWVATPSRIVAGEIAQVWQTHCATFVQELGEPCGLHHLVVALGEAYPKAMGSLSVDGGGELDLRVLCAVKAAGDAMMTGEAALVSSALTALESEILSLRAAAVDTQWWLIKRLAATDLDLHISRASFRAAQRAAAA